MTLIDVQEGVPIAKRETKIVITAVKKFERKRNSCKKCRGRQDAEIQITDMEMSCFCAH